MGKTSNKTKAVCLSSVKRFEESSIDGWDFDLLQLDKAILNYIDTLEARLDRLERVLNLEGTDP